MKTCLSSLALGLVALSLVSSPALAQSTRAGGDDEPEAPLADAFAQSALQWRAWGANTTLPELDGGENTTSRDVYHRLRTRLDYSRDALTLRAEADLLAGLIAGDTYPGVPLRADTGTRPRARVAQRWLGDALDPRQLYVSWLTPVGLLQVGMQTSTWGIGLVANAGDAEGLFNQSFGGDRAARALFATTPFAAASGVSWGSKLYVGVGADMVWRDDFASFVDGDRAYQGLLSIFWRDDDTFAGLYTATRRQVDVEGSTLAVSIVDVAMTHEATVDDRFELAIGAEAATLFGQTNRTYPRLGGDRVDVRAGGFAADVRLEHPASGLAGRVMFGAASGDANTDDDTLYRFRFDPNYKVGLVLFDHYIPAVTRLIYERAGDLGQLGQAPRGLGNFVNDGSVENAVYVNPQLLFGDDDRLLAGVGVLKAWSPAGVADLYETFENGGVPTGVRGSEELADLGWEVDLAARYRLHVGAEMTLEFKAEAGVLFPGSAFDDVEGAAAQTQALARGRVAFEW